MSKALVSIAILVAILFGGFLILNNYLYQQKQGPTDYKDATYIIDGTPVTLVDGVSEVEQAGSEAKIVTNYFGNEVKTDLDGDGIPDLAFLFTQQTGGSGTFFYLVGAIQTPQNTYNGTHGVFLGDRIAPQTTEVSRDPNHKNVIVVNYADRKPGEPMTTEPSQGKSIWLKLDPETMQFGDVAQNFEGEADPSVMLLDIKPWVWQSAFYNDGREIKPKQPGVFVLTLDTDGGFTAATDCNSVGGKYSANDGRIMFSDIISTLMYCEGSQEAEFVQLLSDAIGYHFTSRGELVLDLKFDSGSVVFK